LNAPPKIPFKVRLLLLPRWVYATIAGGILLLLLTLLTVLGSGTAAQRGLPSVRSFPTASPTLPGGPTATSTASSAVDSVPTLTPGGAPSPWCTFSSMDGCRSRQPTVTPAPTTTPTPHPTATPSPTATVEPTDTPIPLALDIISTGCSQVGDTEVVVKTTVGATLSIVVTEGSHTDTAPELQGTFPADIHGGYDWFWERSFFSQPVEATVTATLGTQTLTAFAVLPCVNNT
jgi:hypothetical protein